MDQFIVSLHTPYFWFSAVVVGVIISVTANYSTRLLDKSFSHGTSWLRAVSQRNRDKRAATADHISRWVDAHENGAAVALIESHSLNLAGLLFILASLVGVLAMDMPRVAAMSSIEKLAIELIFVLLAIIGLGALNIGGTIREALLKHPKALLGLHPVTRKH